MSQVAFLPDPAINRTIAGMIVGLILGALVIHVLLRRLWGRR